jgi:small-conductance mechanosensitive channel
MRVAMAVIIVVLTVLIVLSELGVNIAPLIAGASVVGLAISFGSQTLVRDVVSGIFFLADDAFRVGEYVDVGKAKGTVEGFTLRSIRLRHQNGQVHTIPFGQLGQITNHSRDWTTVKFNLRFARDTDIEKLRKTVKKIGQEMMADPELKRDLLQPLKMQGVADIADNALVVRFKFTCRPIKPTFIQRQAIKRMFHAFPAAGIEFAQATINVQALGGGHHDPALLGGAAALQSVPVAAVGGAGS